MYTLSHLPMEILYLITSYLDLDDVVLLARLNFWYSYWLSFVLGERIHQQIDQEGWRVHIDILAKSYPCIQQNLPFSSSELLLLSSYARIHPITLTVELRLCPVEQNGIDTIYNGQQSDRSVVLLNKTKTNIDLVAYVAQISSNHRLQYVHQAGAAIMSDRHLWEQLTEPTHHSTAVAIASGFHVNYRLKRTPTGDDQVLIQQHERELAIVSFDHIQISPEWWLKQLKKPLSHHDVIEHGFW